MAVPTTEEQKLIRDSKSRFNIGVVYLKTKDYVKATENLEHSLYSYLQVYGVDSKTYSDEAACQIATVREKIGDCYAENPVHKDKCIAVDHYVEVQRLLHMVDRRFMNREIAQVLDRAEQKMTDPVLCHSDSRAGRKREVPMPPTPPFYVNKRAVSRKKGREVPLPSEGNKDLRRRSDTPKKVRGDVGLSSAGTQDRKTVAADGRFRALSRGKGRGNARMDPPEFEGKHNTKKIGRGFIESLGGVIDDADNLLKKRGGSTQAAPANRGLRTRRGPVFREPVEDDESFVRLNSTTSASTAKTWLEDSMESIDPASPNPTRRDIAAAKKIKDSTRPARAETSDRPNVQPADAATTGMNPYTNTSNAKGGGQNQVEPTRDQWAKVRVASKGTKPGGRGIMNSVLLMSQGVHAALDPLLQKNTSSYHEDSSSEHTPRRDSQELIKEYQETADKLRAKLAVERMGFAVASAKSMKQKEELTAQINDLSWKLALREKRINRLEKEMEKMKKMKQNGEVKVKPESWETMDCAQFFSHVEIMFFKLEKELEGCKWVVKTLQVVSVNSPRLPSRLELLLEGVRQMTDIAGVVIDGLSKWISSHPETATKNEELFHHVEDKFTKLQNELNQCKELIDDLAKPGQSSESSNLLGCLNALSDGLNEIAAIKNDLFKVSTEDNSGTTASRTRNNKAGSKTVTKDRATKSHTSNKVADDKTTEVTAHMYTNGGHKSHGSYTTETTAASMTSTESLSTDEPSYKYKTVTRRVASSPKARKPKNRSDRRPRQRIPLPSNVCSEF